MKIYRLGDLVSIRTGKLDANKNVVGGAYPFFTCSVEPLNIDTYSYECECVLVAGNGDLNVKYYNGKFDAYQRTYIIESTDKNILNTKYLYYFLEGYVEVLRNDSIGGVIKYIKLGNLTEAQIQLPRIEIQKKIVTILQKARNIVHIRNKQIESCNQLIKSQFIEMFGDSVSNPKGWNKKKFGEVTVNFDSYRVPVKSADRDKMQGEYPYYGATGIVDYVNDYKLDGTYLLISEDGKSLEFRNKDIAFIASGKIWVNNHAHVLQNNDLSDMLYLCHYINNVDISSFVTGIDQKKLNRSNMDAIPVMIPPIELQKQFAQFVQQVAKLKFGMEKSLKELEDNFDSLIQRAFKGELF